MTGGLRSRRLWLGCGLACWLGAALGCAVPREVHEPRSYPEEKVAAQALRLSVLDARPAPQSQSSRQLVLPADFEAAAQQRLNAMAARQGPTLDVQAAVSASDVVDLVDARGEMTRVSVGLDFEVKVHEGPVLRRSRTQSSSDVPRDEATPEELAFVLRATALDAFDRYWAAPETTSALNADLAAYARAQR